MSFWVYILRCSDGSYYTGHTDNLEARVAQHQGGMIPGCYTFTRRPLACVFSQDFSSRDEALGREQQIKGWSRKKKEAMMRGDWAEVSRLAHSSAPNKASTVRPEPLADTFHPFVPSPSKASVRLEAPASVRLEAPASVRLEAPETVRPEPVEGRRTPTEPKR